MKFNEYSFGNILNNNNHERNEPAFIELHLIKESSTETYFGKSVSIFTNKYNQIDKFQIFLDDENDKETIKNLMTLFFSKNGFNRINFNSSIPSNYWENDDCLGFLNDHDLSLILIHKKLYKDHNDLLEMMLYFKERNKK